MDYYKYIKDFSGAFVSMSLTDYLLYNQGSM